MIVFHKYAVIAKTWEIVSNFGISKQWHTQKISEGVTFRHNRVTSHANFWGRAEGTTILRRLLKFVGSNLIPAEAFFWCSLLPVLNYLTATCEAILSVKE